MRSRRRTGHAPPSPVGASPPILDPPEAVNAPENADPPETTRDRIEAYLRAGAGRYGIAGREPAVALLRHSRRAAADLFWYRIAGDAGGRTVVVKVPGGPADGRAGRPLDRPRMVEPPPLDTKYLREYQALDLLQGHFAELGDPRFGAVPVLDRIDSARAIVMGEVAGRPLKALAAGLTRLYPAPPPPRVRNAVENAGAWLRVYHGLEIDGTSVRHPGRRDFVANVRRYCDYLAARAPRPSDFDALAGRMTTAADRLLPAELPLGLGHGDFAMRNVLVGEAGRVVVLDTTALWRMPVLADLAKFGLALRLARPQVYSHGLVFSERRLRSVERWLLRGYYGTEAPPAKQVTLYALLLLLDKWSFELELPSGSGPARRLRDGRYWREARRLAQRLD